MDGPDTWAGIEAAAAGGVKTQENQKLQQKQRAYNERWPPKPG